MADLYAESLQQTAANPAVQAMRAAGVSEEAIKEMGQFHMARMYFLFWLQPFQFIKEANEMLVACPGLIRFFSQREKFPGLGFFRSSGPLMNHTLFFERVPVLDDERRKVYEAQWKAMQDSLAEAMKPMVEAQQQAQQQQQQ